MSLHTSLANYLSAHAHSTFHASLGNKGGYINFGNSGKRGTVKKFTLSLEAILSGFEDIERQIDTFQEHTRYVEGEWRELSEYFSDLTLKSIVEVQTKPTFSTMSKILAWANEFNVADFDDGIFKITPIGIAKTIERLTQLIDCYIPKASTQITKLNKLENHFHLPKPFLLLAGISGTGKSRFVKQQAQQHSLYPHNFKLISVRPDWHEPSDLLGYVSHLGPAPRFVVTEFLRFIALAWHDAFVTYEDGRLSCKDMSEMTPFWLCLDEMNLAPVEQYFADYLVVLESRCWQDEEYSCAPLLSAELLKKHSSQLKQELNIQNEFLWDYFTANGVALPPNLIVAGTVNMDETTHGFSRKVIDRALTLDFGEFFPNNFDQYFGIQIEPISLGVPRLTQVSLDDLASVAADREGKKTIQFLKEVNQCLHDTPFELAYRALNELLLAVVSFQPPDEIHLYAVWDDFLMAKVLPRLDGDAEKLRATQTSSLLTNLEGLLSAKFGAEGRPDLLRDTKDLIPWRSTKKLSWMQARLLQNGFTSFWP